MKSCYSALMVSFAAVLGVGFVPGYGEATAAEERVVAPAEGVSKFVVSGKSTKFRITVMAIGGGEIKSPKITGKAKLVRATEIVRVGEDGPMIGAIEKEFEFAPTGTGEAVIEIVKVEPTSPDPTSEKYTVTIE